MKKISFLLLFAAAIACKNKPVDDSKSTSAFNISETTFGKIDTTTITEYTLTNPSGIKVSILNYGGTVTKIITKDKSGKEGDIILGFDSLSGYLQKGNPYFGCLVGRYANRIAKGKFALDGKTYQLAVNNGANALHGGLKGYDKMIWKVQKLAGDSSLQLTYHSPDGEEDYPGNVDITVVYSLSTSNELKIEYTATTDKATPINLTNHCYFNLSAGTDSTIEQHELQLSAHEYTPVDTGLIPTGKLEPVKGTPMDFTTAKLIGKDLPLVKGGFDHNWVLNKKGNELTKIGSLYHPTSGRMVDVFTTEPGIQFYSGNFLDGTLTNTKAGRKYVIHSGLCLETQHFPNSPNEPSFPNTILKPGETYHHTTVYQFGVK